MENLPGQTQRKHFADGDFLTRFPASESYTFLIESRYPKPGWKPRLTSEDGKVTFPGSAVLFEGEYHEVRRFESEPDLQLYYLTRWESRFPIRVQFAYTVEECRRLARERKAEQAHRTQTLWIKLLSPILGLLPASDQVRLQNRYGISAVTMTTLSVAILMLAGLFSLIMMLAAMFGGGGARSIHLVGCYFLLESMVRAIESLWLEEPAGSLPVYLAIEIARALRRRFDPAYQQRSFERMESTRHQDEYLNAMDGVAAVSGQDHDLEVISDLPKPHWSVSTGIHYQGTWYGLIDSGKIVQEEMIRYRFLLKKAPEGTVFRATIDYAPDEIRKLYRDARHRDLSTWVETFCLFWGLLPEEDQRYLQQQYDFDALKYTKWSTIALGCFGAGSLIAAFISVISKFSVGTELLWFLISGYLLLESITRWQDVKKGVPTGSVLGIPLRPFAERFKM